MSNFSFIPSQWASIAQTPQEAVYDQKSHKILAESIAQIETLERKGAVLLKQLKAMLA
jgi:hypothetical protein